MATYIINNINDSGANSLRQALTAGGGSGAFDFQGIAGQTITAPTALPDLSGQVTFQGVSVTIDGDLGGVASTFVNGPGTLTLAGTNTFGGTILVFGGELAFSGGSALADTTNVEIYDGTLRILTAETIGGLNGVGGTIALDADFTVNAGGNTVSSVITGSGGFIKAGNAHLTLSGANTYTGATTVSTGVLIVNGSITSATTVAAGATLGGNGTVDAVTVNGTLSAGAFGGAATLQTRNLGFGAGATLEVNLNGTTSGQYDQLRVVGTVTLGGELDVTFLNSFVPTTGDSFVIIDNDGSDAVVGTFTGLAQGAVVTVDGVSLAISYTGGTGNDVTLSYVVPADPTPPVPPNTPTENADFFILPAAGARAFTGGGNDTVLGNDGPDYIQGNAGDDSIGAGAGTDTLMGGQGDDAVSGGQGDDLIFGDLGNDSLAGGQGDDRVQGGQGADLVMGDRGNDTLMGGQGNDVILGGDGADYLSGDLGDDVLTGGAGADVFNFAGGQGRDLVTDFGAGDHIRLSLSQAANFQALASHMTTVGADTVITLGAQTIVVVGVQVSSLSAGDFLFA